MKRIQPVNGYVLIKLNEPEEEKTASGIIIPDTATESKNEGEVVAVSADATKEISVGDRILYKEMSGNELTYDGVKYLLIESGDIIAKFVEGDKI